MKLVLQLSFLFFTLIMSKAYASDNLYTVESSKRFTKYQLFKTLLEANSMATGMSSYPKCDVLVEKIKYITKDVQGINTDATAAIMIPDSKNHKCNDTSPMLLYAHGTAGSRSFDFSTLATYSSSANIAVTFASQGYIVVAPNYAGYDKSSLSYHPYLNKKQQSHEMHDALLAAREHLMKRKINVSEKLFITGYSEGGHVALATSEYFESINEKVTAVAPISGPYAMLTFGDNVFEGDINLGASRYIPLLIYNYQKDYHDIYTKPSDFFENSYSKIFEKQLSLPWDERLSMSPKFIFNPLNESESKKFGFSNNNYLINEEERKKYLEDVINNPDRIEVKGNNVSIATKPMNGFRKSLKNNDLRSYIPKTPILLCGGHRDPVVPYDINTGAMKDLWSNQSDFNSLLDITILDVDNDNIKKGKGSSPVLLGKASKKTRNMLNISKKSHRSFKFYYEKLKETDDETGSYHAGLVTPICLNATKDYFDSF